MSPDEPRSARTVYQLQRKLTISLDGVGTEARVAEFRIARALIGLERTSAMAPSPLMLAPHVAREHSILTVAVKTRWAGGDFTDPFVRRLNTLTGGASDSLPYVLVNFTEGSVNAVVRQAGTGEPRLGAFFPFETVKLELLLLAAGAEFTADGEQWEINEAGAPELYVARPKFPSTNWALWGGDGELFAHKRFGYPVDVEEVLAAFGWAAGAPYAIAEFTDERWGRFERAVESGGDTRWDAWWEPHSDETPC